MIKVDLSGISTFLDSADPDYAAAAQAHRVLLDGSGAGGEFTGWLELPRRTIKNELKSILSAAAKIKSRSKALVVIGIGGSYLGAKAAVDMLGKTDNSEGCKIYFVGSGLSVDYLNDIITELGDDDFDVNVISKSGTTLEPALAFRIFRGLLERKYGKAAKKHIFATTDNERGVLKKMADEEGWDCFVVPDDVGGRYSVLSAVGLLPMAVSGIDISEVLGSASEYLSELASPGPSNPAWQYAAGRQKLYGLGYSTELLAYYEPSFRFMAEWWKQLFGESEGKNGIGIFPASLEYTADLHSMGQFVQDGPRFLMETVLQFEKANSEFKIPFALGDRDGLNYLAGRDLADVNRTAAAAVKSAHILGGVPNIEILVPRRDAAGFGELVVFFQFACAVSAYMSGVNPFDQPGVEAYKKSMFRMLGKPSDK
ncbi:MAG: glucose-6-phosphate isomerase [Ruminococcaceae bacterium]|nr:glucose-6-phosphate isomerase [Oscillospiraceae bacterium]